MNPRVLPWSVGGMLAVLVTVALGWGLTHAFQAAPKTLVGQPGPDLALRVLDGRQIALADLRGTPVVLNFWASWCVPCQQEAPAVNAAAREYVGHLQFLGADIQDTDKGARAFQAEFQVPYPVGPIVRGGRFDYGVTGPPETFFIDRGGVVISKVVGPLDTHSLGIYLSQLQP
jgi:cytochrome c biogenesis protein CcmG, thiol:disulfide interchange protein DsbE